LLFRLPFGEYLFPSSAPPMEKRRKASSFPASHPEDFFPGEESIAAGFHIVELGLV